jgi:RNA polymerase subunit RPABC4/transcription elongation factor Spt4
MEWSYLMNENSTSDCPICGDEGTVTEHTRQNNSEYKNEYFKGLLIDSSTCSACGSEFATPEQINRNAQRVRERLREDGIIGNAKPIHAWIDECVLWELREKARQITLRKKLYGKPTRKSRTRKKIWGTKNRNPSRSPRK